MLVPGADQTVLPPAGSSVPFSGRGEVFRGDADIESPFCELHKKSVCVLNFRRALPEQKCSRPKTQQYGETYIPWPKHFCWHELIMTSFQLTEMLQIWVKWKVNFCGTVEFLTSCRHSPPSKTQTWIPSYFHKQSCNHHFSSSSGRDAVQTNANKF